MIDLFQGDIIKIGGFKSLFMIVSNNAFIQATGVFHVCPVLENVLCEQIKLIDPEARNCRRLDRLPYGTVMDISDALQGIFEYD